MPRRTSAKVTKKVLGAKVEVTEKDDKKVSPLTKYWSSRLKEARDSDNWAILLVGIVIGSALTALFMSI